MSIPLLVLLAGDDEYGDRPAKDIAIWFENHTRSKHFAAKVIQGAMHGFIGKEKIVVEAVCDWFRRQQK